MYDAYGTRGQAKEALEALEAALDRPLRVHAGRGRTYTPPPWTAEEAAACGNATLEHCEAEGITINTYATWHERHLAYEGYVPVEMLTPYFAQRQENGGGSIGIYDFLSPPEEETLATVFRIGELAIGEVSERTLLLYLNWFDYAPYTTEQLAAGYHNQIHMDWLAEMAALSVDDEAREQMEAKLEERRREAFAKYVRKTSRQGTHDLLAEIGQWERQLATAAAQAAQAKTRLRDRQRTLDAMLGAAENDGLEAAQRSYEQLKEDPRIESVVFAGSNLIVNTVGVDIKHPTLDVTAYLGKFRWTVPVDGGQIKVQNLDNAKGGYDHPHVAGHNPCFGNMGEAIYTLIQQGEIYAAVEMMFAFLGSVNLHDDWSRRAAYWLAEAMGEPPLEEGETRQLAGVTAQFVGVDDNDPERYDEDEEYDAD